MRIYSFHDLVSISPHELENEFIVQQTASDTKEDNLFVRAVCLPMLKRQFDAQLEFESGNPKRGDLRFYVKLLRPMPEEAKAKMKTIVETFMGCLEQGLIPQEELLKMKALALAEVMPEMKPAIDKLTREELDRLKQHEQRN